ncbi:MAG: sulfatase-like hydrolase/transferase, partial [Planctomycetota bacterium]
RKDCSPFAWYLHWNLPEPRLSWLDENDQLANLTRSYLGCIAFMDDQLARVLGALEKSAIADNTIVCLWSDHGWHLGEKNITGKNTLWEPSTRVPLIFSGPGISPGICQQPAELLDVYPTLADLAGLPKPDGVEGISLRPQIEFPNTPRRPAITDHNPGNQSVRDARYRLIRYYDGSEELYDITKDPNEITNLIADQSLSDVAESLRAHVDPSPAPLVAGSAARILEQTEEGYVWERKVIDPDNPPLDIAPHSAKDLPR